MNEKELREQLDTLKGELIEDVEFALGRGECELAYWNTGMGSEDMPIFLEVLNQYPKITTLNLRHNNIMNVEPLASLKYIKALDLSKNNMDDEEVKALVKCKAEVIDVTGNALTDAFLKHFENAPHIRQIICGQTPNCRVTAGKLDALNKRLNPSHDTSSSSTPKGLIPDPLLSSSLFSGKDTFFQTVKTTTTTQPLFGDREGSPSCSRHLKTTGNGNGNETTHTTHTPLGLITQI